jgi:drug/metabolite transporter superfamily protein YnfA
LTLYQNKKEVIDELDSTQVLSAGIVFMAVYVILLTIGSLILQRKVLAMFGGGFFEAPSIGFGDILRALAYPLIGAASFVAGFLVIAKLIKKEKKDFSTHIFSAGITLLPLSITVFLASILMSIPFLASFIILAGLSSFILILNGAMETTYGLSKKSSMMLIPILLYATYFVYYIIAKL